MSLTERLSSTEVAKLKREVEEFRKKYPLRTRVRLKNGRVGTISRYGAEDVNELFNRVLIIGDGGSRWYLIIDEVAGLAEES
ncbi:hypothetical protein KJ707_01410 [Patescibacteria group bacterium]|nr:hypothetical protein [Patescibacteria group bacterium]